MMPQNNCINNDVTDDLKYKKEKKTCKQLYMQTALKERKVEWLIRANTQNVLYLLIVATRHKTRQRRVGAY